QLPGVVAQVDEDEAAVVTPRVGPTGDRQLAADVLASQLPAVEITPTHEWLRVATRSLRLTTISSWPSRRIVASPSRTTTTLRAPVRPACVICPLNERPA